MLSSSSKSSIFLFTAAARKLRAAHLVRLQSTNASRPEHSLDDSGPFICETSSTSGDPGFFPAYTRTRHQPTHDPPDPKWLRPLRRKDLRVGVHEIAADDVDRSIPSGANSDEPYRAVLLQEPILQLHKSPDEHLEFHEGHVRYRMGTNFHLISYVRLRDRCSCAECVHSSTRQRTRTSGQALAELRRLPFVPSTENVRPDGSGIQLQWPGGHRSTYSWLDIRRMLSLENQTHSTGPWARRLWDEQTLLTSSTRLRFEYGDFDPGLHSFPVKLSELLEQLQKFGLVIIEGVPTDQTSNEECALRRVAGWIGEIRNTFYGETWDVRNEPDSKNVAYTNLNLGLHMDLLYFSSPPRFQALHCLRNRVKGGSSYFVDAFRAARDLMVQFPDSASILRRTGIDYEYDNDGHVLRHRHSVLPGDLDDLHAAVNWSPPFQAEMRNLSLGANDSSAPLIEHDLYSALLHFETSLNRTNLRYEFVMREGDLVLFDNRRVLHARRAFRDWTSEERLLEGIELIDGEPTRWLKGLYLDGEVIWDKLHVLKRQLGG